MQAVDERNQQNDIVLRTCKLVKLGESRTSEVLKQVKLAMTTMSRGDTSLVPVDGDVQILIRRKNDGRYEVEPVTPPANPVRNLKSDELKSFIEQVQKMLVMFGLNPSLIGIGHLEYTETDKDVCARFKVGIVHCDMFMDCGKSTPVLKRHFYETLEKYAEQFLGMGDTFPGLRWNNTELIGRIRINKKAFTTWLVENF